MANLQFKDFIKMRNCYEDFRLFTLEDVEDTIKLMKASSYEQINLIKGKNTTTIISFFFNLINRHNAGRILGSAMWEINYELEKIIYAVDFELEVSVINPKINPSFFKNTTLFITDAMWDPNRNKTQIMQQKQEVLVLLILV